LVPELTVPDPVPAHVPFTEKHPPARSMPRAKVEVADVPVMLRYVDWMPPVNVDVPVPLTASEPAESVPMVAAFENRFVEEAVVEKKVVEVAFVVVKEGNVSAAPSLVNVPERIPPLETFSTVVEAYEAVRFVVEALVSVRRLPEFEYVSAEESMSEPLVVVKGMRLEVRFETASAVVVAPVMLALPSVVSPVTPRVPEKVPFPPVSVPIVAVFERMSVVEARPETWSAVEVALMNVLSVKSVVEARSVLPWSVVKDDDACEMRPLVNVMSPAAVSAS